MKKGLFFILVLSFIGCNSKKGSNNTDALKANVYKPTWSSLQQHETPQWLKDAKFGIYTHFSLESMRFKNGNENKHFHELLNEFKFENFNAAAWAELFKRAGAKFAGPVAWHGSGMVHWNSDVTEFDVVDKGPKKDITGLLKEEITKRDMKFLMSFHTGYWYRALLDRDNPGRKKPEFYELYGEPHDENVTNFTPWKDHAEKQSKYSNTYSDLWLKKMMESTTKYSPDISWADVSFGGSVWAHNVGKFKHGKTLSDSLYFGGYDEVRQRKYLSHFFNNALEKNKEVEFVYKEHDIPPGIGMRNFENGLIDKLTYDTWMTDIDICNPVSWWYKPNIGIKKANLLVDMLVDITAKNGILLLNVPPKPDGTFAQFIKDELYEVGDWLQLNGEAIYGTMPWSIYGEGPSYLPVTGHYSEKRENAKYTDKDFRFTQKDNTLYAICLGIPKGEITINSLGSNARLNKNDIVSLELIGSDAKIEYHHNPYNLTLQMPANFEGKYACVFKIKRKS
ncbi:alpha-L-fucosidase [Seonamhaeicola algicola]|uniref:alpha-L-fucosidase n=1 Tax=Seonamhaeicola algicola TaxID=1719036 RepID=UPI00164A8E46|nr:alpha-L-fucosidase [Seonamhaeicola algicola]